MKEYRYTFRMQNSRIFRECYSDIYCDEEKTCERIFRFAKCNEMEVVWIKDCEGNQVFPQEGETGARDFIAAISNKQAKAHAFEIDLLLWPIIRSLLCDNIHTSKPRSLSSLLQRFSSRRST